jgi:hypothetical protein
MLFILTLVGSSQPTSIVHDFTAEEFKGLSQELDSYLNIKSALQEMEGIYNILNINDDDDTLLIDNNYYHFIINN